MTVGKRERGCLRLELSRRLGLTALGYSGCMQDVRLGRDCDSDAEACRIGSRQPFNLHVRRIVETSMFTIAVMLGMNNATCCLAF